MSVARDEETLRRILEAAPDGIIVVDNAGRIRVVNRQVELLFGYDREELIGKRVEMLVPPHLRRKHARHRAGFASTPETRPMGSGLELKARRKDGTELPVEISLSPMEGPDGPLVTAIVRDVSEHRATEEERQRLRAQVERQLVRDSVARDLHDEIIQAVYAVGLNLQAARSQEGASTDVVLDRARQELGAVIADLRSYIRYLTTGGEQLSLELLETRLRSLLEQSQGHPNWSVTIDLRDNSSGGIEREIYLIARELISNVQRHADAERASLLLRTEDGGYFLQVNDDGHGFERGSVHADSVGLRSVEQRVAELDGSVLIETRPGDGTRVTARIPRPVAEEE